jgi:hypothetical protein
LVHGWDIATGARKEYLMRDPVAALALRVATILVALDDGLHYRPLSTVERDAPPSRRLLALTGRAATS